jgi:hypothetical protein
VKDEVAVEPQKQQPYSLKVFKGVNNCDEMINVENWTKRKEEYT